MLRRASSSSLALIRIAVGCLLGLPLLILSPLYRIEIQRLPAERIGHLALEPELFLCTRHTRGRSLTFFYARKPFANPFLLSMWRRVLRTGPSWLLGPAFDAGERFPWLNLSARGWDRGHFDLRPLDDLAPHVKFTKGEKEEGIQLLANLGVPIGRPYVCLAVRDDAYLAATAPTKDWSYHDYRDSQLADYAQMAEWLTSAGYAVLRMGSHVRRPLESDNPLVIDYASSKWRSDFGDVFLFAHCAFCISTATGMDSLAMLFRRPLGIVNLPVVDGMQLGGPLRLVMFKDLTDTDTGIPLSLLDDRRSHAMKLFRTNDFTEMGLTLVDNEPEELVDFAREMVAVTNDGLPGDPICQEREERFLQKLMPGGELNSASFRISPSWLRRHPMD